MIDAVGIKGRHRVEGLPRPQPCQHLLATSGGETIDTHLSLRDKVSGLAAVALKDDHLTRAVSTGVSHARDPCQHIVGEAGEQGDTAEDLSRRFHRSIIVAESAAASRTVSG